MSAYNRVRRLSGWLAWQDFQIMSVLIAAQNSNSKSILEIGVHHGKSFVAMAIASGGRKLYAIDLFGRQDLNIDSSGSGDKMIFLKNLKDFGVDLQRVVIDERLSSEVSASDVASAVGDIDFFHIDGGHHFSAVSSDLDLACKTLSDAGIVAIDDTYRPEWPEVTQAVFASQDFMSCFRLFAIGFNKSYWCRESFVDQFQNVLMNDPLLAATLVRKYPVGGRVTLIFQRYPLPEWSLRQRISWYMGIYYPRIHIRFKRNVLVKRLFGAARVLKRRLRR